MTSNNYVVRDIVQYIHDDREYRSAHSFSGVFDKLKANFWIFVIIVGLSSGSGYLAVVLPSMIEKQQASIESMGGNASVLREKFNKLSAEQKTQLLQQYGGGFEKEHR